MTEPCDLSAREARHLIGGRSLSPAELLESCLTRIEQVNPAVNAFVALDVPGARSAAKQAEDAVMRGDELPLLHGLPVGIKDLDETAGLRTTWGSLEGQTEDAPPMLSDFCHTVATAGWCLDDDRFAGL